MAKKLLIACNLLIVLILFSSASSFWEGSSSADMNSALPERGLYVASSSFPRYTVVDIVNLENSKTIQAIVVDNYSSPGNAVVLSRDAAEALGMGKRSSVRVRISLPSDSETFSPFADGRSFSGDPDYDPKAFVRENTLPKETQAIVSPPARRDDGYPSVPPPVEIIPDPVKAPVEVVPEAPKTEMAQADVPSTAYPRLPPVEPMPFFMPLPMPTGVFVEDENPVPEAAQGAAQELPSEPAQLETPSTVTPAPSAPELSMFIPMPLPTIIAFEENPKIAQETAPDFEAFELPEISEAPYALSSAGQVGALPYPDTPDYVLVPELEPESPFPDLSPMYPNPAGDNEASYMALNEAARDKIDDAFRQEEALAEGLPPELTLPGLTPYENEEIANLDELNGEGLAIGNAGEDGNISDGELPPELTLPGQSPYENETINNLAEVIEGMSDNPDTIAYQNPPETYIPTDRYLDEPSIGNDGGVSKDSDEMTGELGSAEASLVYAEPGMSGTIGLEDGRWVLKNPAGPDYVLGDALPPETSSPLFASADESEEKLYDAIFGGEGFADAALSYAEPGMEGTIELIDGRWILIDSDGKEYIVSSGLPPEEVLALIERPDTGIELLPDALFREGELAAGSVETSLVYAEPGMEGTIELIDGRWVLRDNVDNTAYLLPVPYENGIGELPEVLLRLGGESITMGDAETGLPYVEPGMNGRIDLVDGHWVLRDSDNAEYIVPFLSETELVRLLPEARFKDESNIGDSDEIAGELGSAETSLVYAEPGMSGTIGLEDGRWVLKNPAGPDYVLGDALPPETFSLLIAPAGRLDGELYDAIFLGEGFADAALSYAEPGMEGTIELIDGRWILIDSDGKEYIVSSGLPPEEVLALIERPDTGIELLPDALFRGEGELAAGSVETSLVYAEPGMEGTIELADGRWVLRDNVDNTAYLLPVPYENGIGELPEVLLRLGGESITMGDAETGLPYVEPGMNGRIDLVDGHWVLRDSDNAEYIVPFLSETELVRLLPEARFKDESNIGDSDEMAGELGSAETPLVYAEPGMSGTIGLEDGRWVLKNPAGPDYVLGDALPPETFSLLIAPAGRLDGELYDAIFLGEGFADAALSYAEPGMEGTIELIDGRWILIDSDGKEYIVSSGLPPEEVLALMERPDTGIGLLPDVLFRGEGELAAGSVETSLVYAEPGMSGTIELADGRWILRDNVDNTAYLLPVPYENGIGELPEVLLRLGGESMIIGDAETGLPYVEPGMNGTIELVDGHWVLRDSDDVEYIVPFLSETELVRLLPEARFKDEYNTGDSDEMTGELGSPETSLVYAEPGMSGTIALIDGRWILIDYADVEYLLPYTGTDLLSLLLPDYIDSAEAGLLYAESGMEGTIELVDGRWIIRDYAGVEYLLQTPYSADLVRLLLPDYIDNAETALMSYVEPDETGIGRLPDAYSKHAETTDVVSELNNLIYILTSEPQFADRATVNLGPYMPYPNDDTLKLNIVFAGDEAVIRNIYNTIVSIESAPNRPPEVIVDLGPIREDQGTNMLYLLPESADTKSGRTASLLLIKHLANDKYYLQIGLFDRKDVLARELTNLNWAYPYALETSENPQSPMYKLLVGPVNEGESNALLLRFKRYGYNDAFIRKEG
jgi:hypothetical protein